MTILGKCYQNNLQLNDNQLVISYLIRSPR
jgi:hypothetical protein